MVKSGEERSEERPVFDPPKESSEMGEEVKINTNVTFQAYLNICKIRIKLMELSGTPSFFTFSSLVNVVWERSSPLHWEWRVPA